MESMNRPGLIDLPTELLHRIFAELGDESCGTFKSLRQTCRRLVVPASEYLFHRIRISSVRHDRDNFLSIAGSPHLVCHVRVVVWEEIAFDGNFATDAPWSTLVEEYPNLAIHLKEVLWLPMLRPQDDLSCMEEVIEFRPLFEQALRAMPALRTIVSEQMNPYRRLLPSRSSTGLEGYYPIPAHHLQRITHPKVEDADVLFNGGFFAFLVPAMSRLAQARSEESNVPSITHLQVFFEQDRSLQDTWPLAPFVKTANPFSSLTHVDICISGPWRRYNSNDHTGDQETVDARNRCQFANIEARVLGILRSAAASITHLHLCRQNTWDDWGHPGRSIVRSLPQMSRLRALHLDGVYHEDTLTQAMRHSPLGTDEERATGYKESALVEVLRAHKKTLREVFIKGTPVTFDVLVSMRENIPGLQLKRFEARPFGLHGNDDATQTFVDEKDVLEFVNNKVATISMVPTVFVHEGLEKRMELTTVDMDEDELEMTTATDMERHFPYWSRCRPRVKIPDPEEDVEEIPEEKAWTDRWGRLQEFGETRVRYKHQGSSLSFSHEAGLWEDDNGFLYDPARDEDIGNTEDTSSRRMQRNFEDKQTDHSLWSHNDARSWDPDMGLWRGYSGSWYRYATDPPTPTHDATEVDMEPLDVHDENNNNKRISTDHCARRTASGLSLGDSSAAETPEEVSRRDSEGRPLASGKVVRECFDDVNSVKCRREHISHLRRQRLDRGWNFARDEHGRVWFRPATKGADASAESSNHDGTVSGDRDYPTQLWLFTRHNGEQAYGDEPLDFWSDWEGSQAGDSSEATPFGTRLRHLAHGSPEEQSEEALMSILSSDTEGNDGGGEEWVRYDRSNDWPYVIKGVRRSLPGPLMTGNDVPLPGDRDASYRLPEYL